MKELTSWPKPDPIKREKLWPDKWFDGRIVQLDYGDEPWWPETRDTESVRTGLHTIAKSRGISIRTQVSNDGYTITFQATGAID